MKFKQVIKYSPLIISVACFVLFNSILNSFNSFVLCCGTGEELFLKNDEQTCCVCCNNAESSVNKIFFTNHWIAKTKTTINDCDSCVCIPYINKSENYFVLFNSTFSPLHSLPISATTVFAEKNVPTTHPMFSPTTVNQYIDCLSTVVLLI